MALFVSKLSFMLEHSSPRDSAAKDNIDASRLSPPVTPFSETDVPFKAPESDRTSLNMTKRPKYSRYHSKNNTHIHTYVSYSKTDGNPPVTADVSGMQVARNKSMPSIHADDPLNLHCAIPIPEDDHKSPITRSGSRRWTLPAKTTPTKGLTTLQSCVKYERNPEICPKALSPAMITLRRASTNPASKTGLTFFPPPTFSRSRSGFMAHFLASLRGEEGHTSEDLEYLAEEIARDVRKRLPSIMVDSAQPSVSITAQPMLTRVSTGAIHENEPLNELRRVSTYHTSNCSTYEVIWDPHDSRSSGSAPSPRLSGANDQSPHTYLGGSRRGSVAVDMLETQLAKDTLRSRTESQLTPYVQQSGRKPSFQSMINHSFAKYINDAALQNLPRSRYPNKHVSSPHVVVHDIEQPVSPGEDAEQRSVLRETGLGLDDNNSVTAAQFCARRRSSVPIRKSGMGSMLGISSHARRSDVGTAENGQGWRRDSKAGQRRKSWAWRKGCGSSEAEAEPLLSGVR